MGISLEIPKNWAEFSLGVNAYTCLSALAAVGICCLPCSAELPVPNRGTQLFALIEERGGYPTLVAMTPPHRPVIQQWHCCKGIYDFISAVVTSTNTGCKVSFTRYVMKEDYIPRVEHLELMFPYTSQPRYPFFDYGYITGFYRNSVDDIP